MKNYVLGFMIDEDKQTVLLIEKNRPEWQKGKLNGIGGKVEDGEEPEAAMSREFEEETGVCVLPEHWEPRLRLVHDELWTVYVYVTFVDHSVFDLTKTVTDEELHLCSINELPERVMHNLTWMINMSLDKLAFPLTMHDKGDH